MFKNPFSFEGRIRRLEFGITFIICGTLGTFFGYLIEVFKNSSIEEAQNIIYLIYSFSLINLWVMLAQGAKREHDLGYNGLWQLIPFRYLWLIFLKGEPNSNKYGDSPKMTNNPNNIDQLKHSIDKNSQNEFDNKLNLLEQSFKAGLIDEQDYNTKKNYLNSEKRKAQHIHENNKNKASISEHTQAQLNSLKELLDNGILTQDEFETKKDYILKNEIKKSDNSKDHNTDYKNKEKENTNIDKVDSINYKNNKIDYSIAKMDEIIANLKKHQNDK